MASPPQGKPGDALLLAMWTEWHDGAVSMATNDELSLEWSMLNEDYYTWDDSDLQLAAELGKTLLERNKELETGLKQQQSVIDDQSQEIEYLSKQSVALREVNDSRLRVYEQLEVSIQELEVTNQRLLDEASHDKKRIRSLSQTVECLEARGAELQALVDELRAAERLRRAASSAEQQQRHSPARRDSQAKSRADELAERVALLERQLSESRDQERLERQRRQQSEAEAAAAQEECEELRQEMAALRERSVKLHTLAEEVHAMEEHRLSPFLRQPSPRACSASPQMAAVSPGAVVSHQVRSVWGDQAVARWPSAEEPAAPAPTPAEEHGSAPASLISDLDAHYRVLLDEMDKYECLLSARQARPPSPEQASSLSLLQELQLSLSERPAGEAPLRDSGPDSLMLLAASDGDGSSSGFSEGSESRTVSRATQTPEAAPPARRLATGVFQHTPQYKQLFQEIFDVLKKPVAVPLPPPPAAAEEEATAEPAVEATTAEAPLPAQRGGDAAPPPEERYTGPAAADAGVARAFSYTEEFERLKASEAAGVEGAAEAPPGGAPAAVDEFPHLARPSEEVAKLRLLERSYAEALKAGRRCLQRPTLL